jgi:hypothetical protein
LGVPNLQFHRSMESGAGAHALQDLPAHRSRPVNAKRPGVRNASSALAVHPTPSANSCRPSAFPAAKPAFPPNYFHFCKSAFMVSILLSAVAEGGIRLCHYSLSAAARGGNARMMPNVQSSGTAAERDVEWNDDKQIS